MIRFGCLCLCERLLACLAELIEIAHRWLLLHTGGCYCTQAVVIAHRRYRYEHKYTMQHICMLSNQTCTCKRWLRAMETGFRFIFFRDPITTTIRECHSPALSCLQMTPACFIYQHHLIRLNVYSRCIHVRKTAHASDPCKCPLRIACNAARADTQGSFPSGSNRRVIIQSAEHFLACA